MFDRSLTKSNILIFLTAPFRCLKDQVLAIKSSSAASLQKSRDRFAGKSELVESRLITHCVRTFMLSFKTVKEGQGLIYTVGTER